MTKYKLTHSIITLIIIIPHNSHHGYKTIGFCERTLTGAGAFEPIAPNMDLNLTLLSYCAISLAIPNSTRSV